jgi:hypothetical protein
VSLTDEFRVGTEVHGFANGIFGRDSYGCRRIEAMGADWVVTRMLDSPREPEFVSGSASLHWLKDAIEKPSETCMCEPYDPNR